LWFSATRFTIHPQLFLVDTERYSTLVSVSLTVNLSPIHVKNERNCQYCIIVDRYSVK
jgi:hypothetical protein